MKGFDLTRTEKVVLGISAVYVISQFDIIPMIIAGPLGLTDDLAAVAVIGLALLRAHRRAEDAPGPDSAAASTQ